MHAAGTAMGTPMPCSVTGGLSEGCSTLGKLTQANDPHSHSRSMKPFINTREFAPGFLLMFLVLTLLGVA